MLFLLEVQKRRSQRYHLPVSAMQQPYPPEMKLIQRQADHLMQAETGLSWLRVQEFWWWKPYLMHSQGANILAEVIGYGATSDAYHMVATHPEGRGAYLAMRAALRCEAGASGY